MSQHDPDQQIQVPPNVDTRLQSLGGAAEPWAESAGQPGKPKPRGLYPGLFFGALVGLLAGAVVGGAWCWLAGLIDSLWQGVLLGALIGPLGGALIGLKERRTRGALVRPDVATIICPVYGLVPVLLLALRGLGVVQGKVSAYLFLGAVSAGPVLGLLLGALLDRAYEAFLRKSWSGALGFGGAAVAGCAALLYMLVVVTARPDPETVALQARDLILRQWKKDPELRSVKIQNITLIHKGGPMYAGFLDATIGGVAERLRLEVRSEADGSIEVQLKPMKE
jgi:hypothetical protein